jgi:hypothetical protein
MDVESRHSGVKLFAFEKNALGKLDRAIATERRERHDILEKKEP